MKKVLVTGFDPFGGEAINPAFEVVKLLPNNINGSIIEKLEIPTIFHESIEKIIEKVKEIKPDYIISIGQAGGRFDVTPERIAINVDDARIPDNKGNQPLNQSIFSDGENAYFSKLPVKAIVEAIKEQGIPSSLSNTAGTFVCNHVMYGVLYHVNTNPAFAHIKAGFIHIPFMTEQIISKPNTPSLSLSQMAKAIETAIEAVLEHDKDIDTVEGKTE